MDLAVEPHGGHLLLAAEAERVELEGGAAVFGVLENVHRVVGRAAEGTLLKYVCGQYVAFLTRRPINISFKLHDDAVTMATWGRGLQTHNKETNEHGDCSTPQRNGKGQEYWTEFLFPYLLIMRLHLLLSVE